MCPVDHTLAFDLRRVRRRLRGEPAVVGEDRLGVPEPGNGSAPLSPGPRADTRV